jgi:transcriptional regulator with XRE-family HTH domain
MEPLRAILYRAAMGQIRPVGDHLREWRQRRRMSQLELACEAEISTKHLSFLETGRAQPSREMILHLAERLDVPLRERNVLLMAGGYAPIFAERPLADPALESAREAVDLVLTGHNPYPALAIDGHWFMVAANRAATKLLTDVDPLLLRPPINVLRLSLHPSGLAPRIANLSEWRAHLLGRLRRQIDVTADPALAELMRELREYPAGTEASPAHDHNYGSVIVPLELVTATRRLALFSTTTVFGTPLDVTLSELALELFFPADSATTLALRALAEPAMLAQHRLDTQTQPAGR